MDKPFWLAIQDQFSSEMGNGETSDIRDKTSSTWLLRWQSPTNVQRALQMDLTCRDSRTIVDSVSSLLTLTALKVDCTSQNSFLTKLPNLFSESRVV